MKVVKVILKQTQLEDMGVVPMILYNKIVDFDCRQKLLPSFKGGEVTFFNDGSNYSRRVFKDSLSRARLLSN